jgi:hypothetical protein
MHDSSDARQIAADPPFDLTKSPKLEQIDQYVRQLPGERHTVADQCDRA